MDPQRFDQIMAEINRGYADIRHNFTVRIAEILEEVVTDYVYNALDAATLPNFAELAILLYGCANLYGRKVDYLYENVLALSQGLPSDDAEKEAPEPAHAARRRRRPSGARLPWAAISLCECSSARLPPEKSRPPPTLARPYVELEPRAPQPHEKPLLDRGGASLGCPAQYSFSWRLDDGLMVEELDTATDNGASSLRPLSLVDLQEALMAAAPVLAPSPLHPPVAASTPLPCAPSPPVPSPPAPSPLAPSPPASPPGSPLPPSSLPPSPLPPLSLPPSPLPSHLDNITGVTALVTPVGRKRRNTVTNEEIEGPLKFFVSKEIRASFHGEFSVPHALLTKVVGARARGLLLLREQVTIVARASTEFHGFEDEHPNSGGFLGWSQLEVDGCQEHAASATLETSQRVQELESDDDGFFECSSIESDCSHTDCAAAKRPQSAVSKTTKEEAVAVAEIEEAVAVTEMEEDVEVTEMEVDVAVTEMEEVVAVAEIEETVAVAEKEEAKEVAEKEEAKALAEKEEAKAVAAAMEAEAWIAGVAARAEAEEARGPLDVRALGRSVLAALPAGRPQRFAELLRSQAHEPRQVSRVLLSVLFLANSGNVEITPSEPLSLEPFTVNLVSKDERLYAAETAEHFAPMGAPYVEEAAPAVRPEPAAAGPEPAAAGPAPEPEPGPSVPRRKRPRPVW